MRRSDLAPFKAWLIEKNEILPSWEIVELFNKEHAPALGYELTLEKFKHWKANNKIKTKIKKRPGKKIFTENQEEFIRQHVKDYNAHKMADELKKIWPELAISWSTVRNWKRNNGCYGYTFRGGYSPEHPNPHKGQKGWSVQNSANTRFQKGHTPKRTFPVDSVRISPKTGQVYVKVSGNRWKLKSHIVYEQHFRPLKKGEKIIFLDGNKENFDPSNLMAITHSEQLEINRNHYRSENPEETKAGVLISKINTELKKNDSK